MSSPRRDQPTRDVIVIGAGIHGVGVAQAAAAAGYSVTVLERRDVAAETSSRSSKLIHGGLRYLESFQLGLVRESLRERAILLRIAPHLVRLVPFYIPIYAETTRGPLKVRAGLSLYALLGGLESAARFESVPRDAWRLLDGLSLDGLRHVFRYMDGQTDDAALCRAVLASGQELGAEAVMGTEVVGAERDAHGWTVRCRVGGDVREVRARALVNAAGPWVNRVLDRFNPPLPRREIELVGGTHIELSGELEQGIYYTEAPADRRAVFTMPWKGHLLVGTTERPFAGDPATFAPSTEEIDYLLDTHRRYFPGGTGELLDAWAGLRVLPRGAGRAFSRPREVLLAPDDARAPTALSIYGGKLTGYRATAAKVMTLLERRLPRAARRADTATLRLPDVAVPARSS
jgi:glycerol-3-phosphate dehydrogenase